MPFRFETKNSPNIPDPESKNLSSFLLSNKQFLSVALFMLDIKKEPTDISLRINNSPKSSTIKGDVSFGEFINLMDEFYNTTQPLLDSRRGWLLELLVGECYPTSRSPQCCMIPECLVYYLGSQLSKKDVDVVFKDAFIELLECKAAVINYLHPPLPDETKDKLRLMERVKDLANAHSLSCNIYLATFNRDLNFPKSILRNNGFDSFKIMNRKDIVNRLQAV